MRPPSNLIKSILVSSLVVSVVLTAERIILPLYFKSPKTASAPPPEEPKTIPPEPPKVEEPKIVEEKKEDNLKAEKEAKEAKDKEEKKKRRYDTKKEFYSPQNGMWIARDDKTEDIPQEYLFTAADRIYPKSQDFAGNEDFVSISLHSQHLIDILRFALTESEEMLNDEPNVDARELFLKRKEIDAVLLEKQAEVALLEKADASEAPKEDSKAAEAPKEKEDPVEPGTIDITPVASGDKVESTESEAPQEKVVKSETSIEKLKKEIEHAGVLLGFLDSHFASTKSKLDRLLVESSITYALLWSLFPPGCLVETMDPTSEQIMAFRLRDGSYTVSRDGPVFTLSGKRLVWTGARYAKSWIHVQIPKFKGMRQISSLSARPLTDEHKSELSERGRTYTGLSGVSFKNYDGVLVQVLGYGMDKRIVKLRAEGRAVIDTKSYRRMNPSRYSSLLDDAEDGDDEIRYPTRSNPASRNFTPKSNTTVADEDLCLLPPTVFGFSLVVREWGEMRVDQFSPVVFSNAWDHLVLDASYKDLIKSLVQQHSSLAQRRALTSDDRPSELCEAPQNSAEQVTDVISGKGGGLVIVLHGKPGVGKTLTAEAVAELLQVPLYSVGAGELGTQAVEVENKLRDILSLSSMWGAILLIDEADVFLEERGMHDLIRNAMVSVFLRLLEYHSGILFLTTNRIRSVDEAFLSRFSVALTYENLDLSKRRIIWNSFLNLAGVTITDPDKCESSASSQEVVKAGAIISTKYLDKLAAKTNFNGRSIKNCVRTALSLANSHQVPLSSKELDTVIHAFDQFAKDFQEPDEQGVYEVKGEGWKDRSNAYC